MVCLTGTRPVFMMGESGEDSVMEWADFAPDLAPPVGPPQLSFDRLGLLDANQSERYLLKINFRQNKTEPCVTELRLQSTQGYHSFLECAVS